MPTQNTGLGPVRFSRAKSAHLPNPKDAEYRLVDVWNPAKYMAISSEEANGSLSAVFHQYFSIPTKGFTPVSLTHAKFIFYTFRITPGPWKALGRIIKGIHWQVSDEYAQVKASYNKTTGIFLIESVEGEGDFIPALHQPSYAENIWKVVAQAIKHYLRDVYNIVTAQEEDDFKIITENIYQKPIKWTTDPIVDYLALYLSYFEAISKYLNEDLKDDNTLIYFRETQVTLKEHLEPLEWIHTNIYRRFNK